MTAFLLAALAGAVLGFAAGLVVASRLVRPQLDRLRRENRLLRRGAPVTLTPR